MSRTLSFVGAEFETIECNVPVYNRPGGPIEGETIYDAAASFWQSLYKTLMWGLDNNIIQYPKTEDCPNRLDSLRLGAKDTSHAVATRYYWGANQRFFRSLCAALKVQTAVSLTQTALQQGKSVVIGLQSTGEAACKTAIMEMEDIISSPFMILQNVIKKLIPIPVPDSQDEHSNVVVSAAIRRTRHDYEDQEDMERKKPRAQSPVPIKNKPIIINLVDDDEGEPEVYICSDSDDDDTKRSPSILVKSEDSASAETPNCPESSILRSTDIRDQLIDKVRKLLHEASQLQLPGHPLDDLID